MCGLAGMADKHISVFLILLKIAIERARNAEGLFKMNKIAVLEL